MIIILIIIPIKIYKDSNNSTSGINNSNDSDDNNGIKNNKYQRP